MCGRYTFFALDTDLGERFGATPTEALEPRYNAAPDQSLPVIRNDSPEAISRLRWGLIPRWADDERTQFINARAETLREKESFAQAFEQRRCLVLADGFYEWTATETGNQPYRVTRADRDPFCMAGLWERFVPSETQSGLDAFTDGGPGTGNPDGVEPDPIETFTIVTTDPNGVVGDLHDRMPVVLPREAERRWLDGDPDELDFLLTPYAGEMDAYPVSRAVNDPANDRPELIEAVPEADR